MIDPATAVETKAFVPAREFDLSLRFYRDLGFTCPWSDGALAYLHCGNAALLLQRYVAPGFAEHFQMHLLVTDVDAWWRHVQAERIVQRYGVRAMPPQNRPWRIRDFVLMDPSGVMWRIGQNLGEPIG
jgi:catechol 2,3-dioxygenase-like lactoylglutathione lyase family enzyme